VTKTMAVYRNGDIALTA